MRALQLGAAAVALIITTSGVAAFESHLVNVGAHVENAIEVRPSSKMIGGSAVFPEEWVTGEFFIEVSSSFASQTRVNAVDFILCAKPKIMPPASGKYYHWMGGGAYFSTDDGATWIHIGPPHGAGSVPVHPTGVVCPAGMSGTIMASSSFTFLLGFDVPVREENYDPQSDVCDKPRPDTGSFNPRNERGPSPFDKIAGGPEDGQVCQAPSMIVANSVAEDGAKYALKIIVQVTDIGSVPP